MLFDALDAAPSSVVESAKGRVIEDEVPVATTVS